MRTRKAQSAIEYLMTYGWMLLVVAVVGGAVFSVVGDQSIEDVQGFNTQDIHIGDFGVTEQSGLVFSTDDPLGQTKVTEVSVSNPDTTNITYQLNHNPSQDTTINLPGITPSENNNELKVEITYDTDTLEDITTSGTIIGDLEVDNNFDDRELILDGLVGYWSFNERYISGETVHDLTTNNNHGSIENNPEIVDGITGEALEFTGGDDYEEYLSLEENIDFGSGDELTATIWINPSTHDGWSGTFLLGDRGSTGEALIIRDDDRVQIRDANSDYTTFGPSSDLYDGSWKNINWVSYGDGTMDVYYNGEHLGDGTDIATKIGFNNVGNPYSSGKHTSLDGKIDDVRVYDRALSEGEIQTIYEQANLE